MLPPVPPWAVGNTPEPVSLDIDGFIDVVAYVRLEEDLSDIQYGVLDIQVNFHHEGSLMNVEGWMYRPSCSDQTESKVSRALDQCLHTAVRRN